MGVGRRLLFERTPRPPWPATCRGGLREFSRGVWPLRRERFVARRANGAAEDRGEAGVGIALKGLRRRVDSERVHVVAGGGSERPLAATRIPPENSVYAWQLLKTDRDRTDPVRLAVRLGREEVLALPDLPDDHALAQLDGRVVRWSEVGGKLAPRLHEGRALLPRARVCRSAVALDTEVIDRL